MDVPTRSWTHDVSNSIIAFISACGEESYWSRLRSKFSYELPPGRSSRASAEASYATQLFALKQIVLEMRSVRPYQNQFLPQSPRLSLKSSVEDADCEVFWSAAAEDFSFFGSSGAEECGVMESERRSLVPLEAQMGKMVVGECSEGVAQSSGSPSERSVGPGRAGGSDGKHGEAVDVLAEISRFRREKKVAHQNAMEQGLVDLFIEGFWEGDIKVIRR
jgi:hypothetical protein